MGGAACAMRVPAAWLAGAASSVPLRARLRLDWQRPARLRTICHTMTSDDTAAPATPSARLLDGAVLAERIRADLTRRVADLKAAGITPGLGTILVGDDPASATYVALKHRDCAEVGIVSFGEHLPAATTQAELLATIARFNANPAIHVYIVQLPLPRGLDEQAALLAVDPAKDADGLHPVNLGLLVMGKPGALPCTPVGIQHLLLSYGVPIEGRHVVIVGRGLTIGRPLAMLLTLKQHGANAAVTVVHTGVPNMADYTRQADILVAAAGSPGLITREMVKPGAAVVGAGVTKEGKRLLSDVADDVAEVAAWITPRIGGVGPLTRAMLLQNAVLAAERVAAAR
jgi:methylenetetrahydrofolate dehydrogenase (NADP+)/methenyltetrahydrofolate cyclohydrolase